MKKFLEGSSHMRRIHIMNKLQIFWKSRKTWTYAFYEWYLLMFPHTIKTEWGPLYTEIDEQDIAYWFFESLNNYNNVFDEWGL